MHRGLFSEVEHCFYIVWAAKTVNSRKVFVVVIVCGRTFIQNLLFQQIPESNAVSAPPQALKPLNQSKQEVPTTRPADNNNSI